MISITVCYATPDKQVEIPLNVEESCTVESAIQRSKVMEQFPEITLTDSAVGIFSERVTLGSHLHDGDRVEIYRPLMMDPKDARRLRVEKK